MKIPDTHFYQRLFRPENHTAAGTTRSTEKVSELSGNRILAYGLYRGASTGYAISYPGGRKMATTISSELSVNMFQITRNRFLEESHLIRADVRTSELQAHVC
jgi:hypothetical protein